VDRTYTDAKFLCYGAQGCSRSAQSCHFCLATVRPHSFAASPLPVHIVRVIVRHFKTR